MLFEAQTWLCLLFVCGFSPGKSAGFPGIPSTSRQNGSGEYTVWGGGEVTQCLIRTTVGDLLG